MVSFKEYLNEQKNVTSVEGKKYISHSANYDIIDAEYTLSNVGDLGWGSPKLSQADMPYYIGTIGYRNAGKEIGYELFELDSHDKAEFGSHGVFMVSGERMIHQVRTIVKIKGNKIYFIDDDAYENGEIKFDRKGVNIDRIVVKNGKYIKSIASMVK